MTAREFGALVSTSRRREHVCATSPATYGAAQMLSALLLAAAAANGTRELWSTTARGTRFVALDPQDASSLQEIPCAKGCGFTSLQPKITADEAGSVIYTLRDREGFFGHIELHSFNLNTRLARAVPLPQFTKFAGKFSPGVWAAQYDSVHDRVLVLGPSDRQHGVRAGMNHTLAAVYPNKGNGTVEVISLVHGMLPSMTTSSAFDAKAQVFYVLYTTGEVSVSVRGLSAATGRTVGEFAVNEWYTVDYFGGSLYGVAVCAPDSNPPACLPRAKRRSSSVRLHRSSTSHRRGSFGRSCGSTSAGKPPTPRPPSSPASAATSRTSRRRHSTRRRVG